MDVVTATGILKDARKAVEAGSGLGGTGFWKLVGEIKRDPDLSRFIDDVAEIDQKAFKNWALLWVPLWLGTTIMLVATAAGLLFVSLAYPADGFMAAVWLLLGTGVLLATTHGLGHLLVGRMVGIEFTGWFIGKVTQPQPGVKTDHASYLRTDPAKRAWMHASGALVTKAIPLLMIGSGIAAEAPSWSVWLLLVLGLAMITTDVLWSTKASDWKKFQREMSFVQS